MNTNNTRPSSTPPDGNMSFWDHLEALRMTLLRILAIVAMATVVAFCFKDELFRLVLWPTHSDFPTYRLFDADDFSLQLINTALTEQFMVHVKVAALIGLLCASPWVIYELLSFVSPALYANERRISLRVTLAAYTMFLIGIALNYMLIFPLTVRFLGGYQVSMDVATMLTISSYIDTLLAMSIVFGAVFELPVVCAMLAWFGMLKAKWMSRVRRHAVVAILIMAAIITPTADIFTLVVVSLPIYLLYEASIVVVRMTEREAEK